MSSGDIGASQASASFVLRIPSKYVSPTATPSQAFAAPPSSWLLRAWTVTHSTLSMWRSAQNVRITYSAGASGNESGNEDRVDYEDKTSDVHKKPRAHVVRGVNTSDPTTPAAFHWRGKGWLFFVTSHWEILGWGETGEGDTRERWVVTWFAPTLFTREGIDFYTDRPAGMRPATVAAIQAAAAQAWPEPLATLARELQPVAITETL